MSLKPPITSRNQDHTTWRSDTIFQVIENSIWYNGNLFQLLPQPSPGKTDDNHVNLTLVAAGCLQNTWLDARTSYDACFRILRVRGLASAFSQPKFEVKYSYCCLCGLFPITLVMHIVLENLVMVWKRLLFFLLVGWDFWYCGHYWPIVQAPDDRWWWLWRNWWNEDWQGKPMYSEKTCPSATLYTTNSTWLDTGLKAGRRGGKPATNRLTYGAAPWKRLSLEIMMGFTGFQHP
jgi:hypothetical protein